MSVSLFVCQDGFDFPVLFAVDDVRRSSLVLWALREIPSAVFVGFQVGDVNDKVDLERRRQLEPVCQAVLSDDF